MFKNSQIQGVQEWLCEAYFIYGEPTTTQTTQDLWILEYAR